MEQILRAKSFMLQTVGAVLAGETPPQPPQDLPFDLVCRLASRNTVQGFLYYAYPTGGEFLPADLHQKLKKSYQTAAFRDIKQEEMRAILRQKFQEAQIDFMFLKGAHLKALYPAPELRFMVDMDTLVRTEDIARAKEILLSLGFQLKTDNGKDIIFLKPPFLTVELHRSLFQEENAMYAYFADVWARARKGENACEYEMTDNDLYVYTLAHLAEHYLEAGSCFRPLMDLYLLEAKRKDTLDFDYIRAQFSALGIEKFAENIRRLAKAMFAGAPYDDTLTMMENYIVLGPPVKDAAAAAIAASSSSSRISRLFCTAFPPYKNMVQRYPVLKKVPILLPFLWIWRLLSYAFTKDERIKQKRERLKNENRKSTDTLQQIFEKSGL
ncbi:MAG: nucleotidyltransferase family protein [Clostridia bacterium]|nr:nucleotidyltransferase family protein [Clostridia bacterium]